MRVAMITAAAAMVLSAAVPAGAASKVKKAKDPSEMVCETRAVTGSRVSSIRECYTRGQWAEMREQERLGLSRKQINGAPACDGGTCMPKGGKDTPW
jgi:hypothetical protein